MPLDRRTDLRLGGAPNSLTRCERGSALAGLRHPANTSAVIASPAIIAARTVRLGTETATVAATTDGTVNTTLPSTRWRWLTIPLVAVALTFLLALPVLSVLPSSLAAEALNSRLDEMQPAPYAQVPGAAQPVDDRIEFGDLGELATQYPPTGDIYFVTITSPRQSLLSWWLGRDDPAVRFLTNEGKNGFRTPQQNRTVALQQMRTSEQVAAYVALSRIGFEVELVPGEVVIEDMVCLVANEDGSDCVEWSPSDDVLDPGDKILSIDGVPVDGVEDLGQELAGRAPGDVVEMTIERPGTGELSVQVELTASPEEPDRTIVGFYPYDTRRVELPFDLDINTGSIGGPSAGLAFTLTLIDELTPGELTGGGSVAVTGTIALDGSVGPIGGLPQKAAAVARQGVDVFLVPTAQGEADIAAAREAGGDDLEIIPVATVDEAIAQLERLGGDPIG